MARAGSEGLGEVVGQPTKNGGQFDFMAKMKWGIGYIKEPGTGPENKRCGQCVHVIEHLEPMATQGKSDKIRMNHLFYCGEVVKVVGPIKAINPETPACSEFCAKKRPA